MTLETVELRPEHVEGTKPSMKNEDEEEEEETFLSEGMGLIR